MKYLKPPKITNIPLFEGYLDNYYSEITQDQWIDDISYFQPMEQQYIYKLIKLNFDESSSYYNPQRHMFKIHNGESYSDHIYIYQITDDYFIIRIVSHPLNEDPRLPKKHEYKYSYFKCDQFEGVIKFLEDKEIIV